MNEGFYGWSGGRLPGGTILQIVTATQTADSTLNSAVQYTPWPNLSLTIRTSAGSKLLVVAMGAVTVTFDGLLNAIAINGTYYSIGAIKSDRAQLAGFVDVSPPAGTQTVGLGYYVTNGGTALCRASSLPQYEPMRLLAIEHS